jgi:hypothetical protein
MDAVEVYLAQVFYQRLNGQKTNGSPHSSRQANLAGSISLSTPVLKDHPLGRGTRQSGLDQIGGIRMILIPSLNSRRTSYPPKVTRHGNCVSLPICARGDLRGRMLLWSLLSSAVLPGMPHALLRAMSASMLSAALLPAHLRADILSTAWRVVTLSIVRCESKSARRLVRRDRAASKRTIRCLSNTGLDERAVDGAAAKTPTAGHRFRELRCAC